MFPSLFRESCNHEIHNSKLNLVVLGDIFGNKVISIRPSN
jgi:hypothetical protein